MNNYKVSFFDGTGYEGALVVTAESADAAEILAKEAADFYGYFSCPDLNRGRTVRRRRGHYCPLP